jgi:phosphoribosylformylglycinamidine synthase subunit PurQ / glutaminase
MSAPRVCVLRAPGTNCDPETAFAFESCGANADRVHLFRLFEQPRMLRDYQILCIPGGFSYGDDVGAGVVFGSELQHRLTEAMLEFLQRETLILGICNGFQVLLKSGILPHGAEGWRDPSRQERQATLTWNANGRYTDLWVHLQVCSPNNAFLRGMETLECPIAHAEGRFVVAESGESAGGPAPSSDSSQTNSSALLAEWETRGQIAVRYSINPNRSPDCEATAASPADLLPYPMNPNGSVRNIAGLGDPSGRILGLMPHPERFLFATQHPQWTRLGLTGDGGGRQVFQNGVDYFA